MELDLRELRFGVEIEMTGITRVEAVQVVANYFGSRISFDGTYYDKHSTRDSQGRKWTFMSDGSITGQINLGGRVAAAVGSDYQVELVTPICSYEDIPTIQQLVEGLRRAGALTNESCGLHIHVDAASFDANSLRNLVNIVAAKEDLLYKALRVPIRREHYCQKMNTGPDQSVYPALPCRLRPGPEPAPRRPRQDQEPQREVHLPHLAFAPGHDRAGV